MAETLLSPKPSYSGTIEEKASFNEPIYISPDQSQNIRAFDHIETMYHNGFL